MHVPDPPVLPEVRMDRLCAFQLLFPYRNGFDRNVAERWGNSRGMRLLQNISVLSNRGDDALTFVKPSVWHASSS